MRAWALWSSRVDLYSPHELIEVFADQAVAEAARDGLIGKPRDWRRLPPWKDSWEDDEDFPDLYVRPIVIR